MQEIKYDLIETFRDPSKDLKCGEIYRNTVGHIYYACTFCPLTFQYSIEYEEHIIGHFLETATDNAIVYQDLSYSEVHCDEQSQPDMSIKIEIESVRHVSPDVEIQEEARLRSTKENHIKCGCCDGHFPCRGLRDRHLIKRPVNARSCDLCPCYYKTTRELQKHVQRHDADGIFSCTYCNELFDTQLALDAHVMPRTANLVEKITEQITKTTKKKKVVKKKKPIPKAEETSSSNSAIGIPGCKSYECDICSRKFALLMNLENHLQRHANNTLYPKCDLCGRQFTQKKNLVEHMQRHNGDKRIRCDVCGKLFFRDSYLRIHMRTHNGERPYQCTLCGKTFKSRSSLLQHARIHDKQIVGSYKCSQCDRTFFNSTRLAEHIRSSHTGEKPFTCEICGVAFSRQKCWKEHVQIHKGKQFPCTYCGILFSQGSGRRRHEKLMHNAPKKNITEIQLP